MATSLIPVTVVHPLEFEGEYWNRLHEFDRVFLAEGDSWFSYGSTKFRNILLSLSLPYRALVVDIAQPGDTLRRMHECSTNPQFYAYLANRGGRKWDAIFVSGGGNDVIDASWNRAIGRPEIYVQPADPASVTRDDLRSCVDTARYRMLLDYLAANIRQIVLEGRDDVDSNSRDIPLFMHTYARLRPRNAPVQFFGQGPWLYPACRWLGIDESLWLDFATLVLGDLAATLRELDLPHFHVIDTFTDAVDLMPSDAGSTASSGDWENEIHPTSGGYRKLAAVWRRELARVLG
jgi:hypothetical protein